jgi:cytolysin-activating lysine-acyltransferase
MSVDDMPSRADASGAAVPSGTLDAAAEASRGPAAKPDAADPARADPADPEARAKLANAERAMSLMLGRVAALMIGSPEHRHLFLADLEWRVVPPLALRQCRLVQKEGLPVAYLSWALVDEAREKRLQGGYRRLAPADWRSGDRLWLVDLIAPGGNGEALAREVMGKLFPGREVKTLAVRRDGGGVGARGLSNSTCDTEGHRNPS